MKLSKNKEYIELIKRALNDVIVPELNSKTAKDTAQLVFESLDALLLREDQVPQILRDSIDAGQSLLTEFSARLERYGLPVPDTVSITSSDSGLSELIEGHANVMGVLDQSAKLLVENQAVGDVADNIELLAKAAEWEYATQAAVSKPLSPAESGEDADPDIVTPESVTQFMQAAEGGSNTEVTHVNRLSGGYGKQTFMLSAVSDDKTPRELVMRMDDPLPMFEFESFNLHREFEIVNALRRVGYPVPNALHYCDGLPGSNESFYIMDKLEGAMVGTFLEGSDGLSQDFLIEWAGLLGKLHSIPMSEFAEVVNKFDGSELLAADQETTYRLEIQKWRDYIENVEHLASPYLTYMSYWLENNIPKNNRPPVLVHGDFYIHNILADNGKVTGVLDWETAMFGAPEQDLAYIQPHVMKYMDWDEFLTHYTEAGGPIFNQEDFAFYTAFAGFRIAVGGNRGTWNLQSGKYTDIRFTKIEMGFVPAFMQMGLASSGRKLT